MVVEYQYLQSMILVVLCYLNNIDDAEDDLIGEAEASDYNWYPLLRDEPVRSIQSALVRQDGWRHWGLGYAEPGAESISANAAGAAQLGNATLMHLAA